MKTLLKILFWLAVIAGIVWLITLNAGSKPDHIDYGVTFSAPYAEGLGLKWKDVYISMLDDLKVKRVRLSAYWDEVEPQQGQYDFEDLNFQIDEASKRGVQIILGVGRRLPRWPECHEPGWIHGLSQQEQENEQLSYMERVVNNYQSNPNIIMWQVENEPFLSSFGICPKLNTDFLEKEIAAVKSIDYSRPVLITDSGEIDMWWDAGSYGDVFGSTFYRYVYSDKFKRYWTDHIPPWFYRFKAGSLRFVRPGKKVAIIELETEAWTTKGIINTPIDEQFKTMSLDNFNTIIKLAGDTGFNPQYLWGVEWWYWMKQQGHPEFWDRARQLFSQ